MNIHELFELVCKVSGDQNWKYVIFPDGYYYIGETDNDACKLDKNILLSHLKLYQ